LIVDFVSMRRRENQDTIYRKLRRSVGDDPLRPHVVGFTKLGLLEMTRRRKGPSLSEIISGSIAVARKSSETIGLEALRGVLSEAQVNSATGYRIQAAPDVISALKCELSNTVKAMEKANGYIIKFKAEPYFGDESFQVSETPKKKK
jgi:ribonuclease E/ribonuclease G